MTILNIHINDKDKKKIQNMAEMQNEKSTSDYIRKILSEQIKIQETALKQNEVDEIIIPDYIPKDKYVGFVMSAIIAVSDSPNEIAQIAVEKFPNFPLIIKYNGSKKKQIEYCYVNLTELNCWKYAQIEDYSYPILPINFKTKLGEKRLSASLDTASTLCVLKNDIYPTENFELNREEQISTASGIIKAKIFKVNITLCEMEFQTEFILAPIPDTLPFSVLIGRNLLDMLDTYLFSKKQILCLKMTE